MKKLSLALSIALALSFFAACGTTTSSAPASASAASTAPASGTTEGGLPPATFSFWTWYGNTEAWNANDLNDVRAFQVAAEKTNTTLEWRMESDTDTFDLMMSTGDVPDAIYYAWNPNRQAQYAAAGNIVNIADAIKENAPNLQKLIDSDPIIQQQLITADGEIYFVPWITADRRLVFGEGFAIRQDWLEKVGMEIPKTPEDFYAALKAFREQDANGNGKKDELITGYPQQLYRLAYAFGTADDMHFADDGKTMVYGPATDNYREFLRFMNKMYSEQLIDPDIFSKDKDLYMKRVMENRVGAYIDNPGVFGKTVKDAQAEGFEIDWAPMPYLEYNGISTNLSSATKRYVQPYGLAITSKCEDVGRMLAYLDYFFTEEGNELMNWGIEGESFTVENGKRVYTDAVMNDPNLEPAAALSKFAHPTFVGIQDPEQDLAMQSELGIALKEAWATSDNTLAAEPFVSYTAEEKEVNSKRTDLDTARDKWRDKFITGEKNIDTDWDAYIAELKSLGLDELVKVQQDALDRYVNR